MREIAKKKRKEKRSTSIPHQKITHRPSLPALRRHRGRCRTLHRARTRRRAAPLGEERGDRALAGGERRGHCLTAFSFLFFSNARVFVIFELFFFVLNFTLSPPLSQPSSRPFFLLLPRPPLPPSATRQNGPVPRRERRVRAQSPGMEAPAGKRDFLISLRRERRKKEKKASPLFSLVVSLSVQK